jgi:hypothetical protein
MEKVGGGNDLKRKRWKIRGKKDERKRSRRYGECTKDKIF